MKISRFKKEKNPLKWALPLFLFAVGFIFTGMSTSASENGYPQETFNVERVPFVSPERVETNTTSSQDNNLSSHSQNGTYSPFSYNPNQFALRLDGIDDDDNGLGEMEVPVGGGFFILAILGIVYLNYRLVKKFTMKTFNKRFLFLIFLLAMAPAYSFAVNYYWVGGNGNWSEISHWATTSGGTVKYTLPPTASDNVIFDAGSGFTPAARTVTLNQNSFCNNMTWQGVPNNPIFTGSNSIDIGGSLLLSPGMQVSGAINFRFVGSLQGNTITTNGVAMTPCTFQGTGGWILADNLNCTFNNNITLTTGTLDFNGKTVTCNTFNSSSTNARTLRIAGSSISCVTWTYNGANSNVLTTVETANSFIKIIGFNSTNLTAKAGDHYYNVEFSSSNASSITNGIYNNVLFSSGSGTITSITTDSLTLKGNFTFRVSAPSTVNKFFAASPGTSCGGVIDITGGTISMTSGAVVDVKNARIKSTIINGPGAPFLAVNSIDAGGNTGWNIQAMTTGSTYYWVGGTGNWSDITHWANTSGGTGGSGCIPTPVDNVIFDNNSGFITTPRTVTMDVSAYCDSMSWLGTVFPPSFNYVSANNALEVYGSLYLQRGMLFNPYNLNMCSNRPNEKLTSNGNMIYTYINFKSQNGTGGWSLQDSTSVGNNINFYNGTLNFNGQYVSLFAFNSAGNSGDFSPSRVLNIANSTIVTSSWEHSGGVTLTAAQSANSVIRVSNTPFIAKTTDKYHYLEAASSLNNTGISNGIYDKITYLPVSIGGVFSGTISTDSLVFENAGNFTFTTNITVNKYFATKLTCGGVSNLTSNNTTEHTIMMGNPSEVHVSYAQISYISISGTGAPYPAVNSLKVAGICAGWNFGAITPNTYYWVGGTGNWNSAIHWSTTSGLQNGSGCVPSPFDNVIFDNNSFSSPSQIVTVDGLAYCDSMSWIGNASLKPSFRLNYTLQLSGSLTFQREMTNVFGGGGIVFNSSRSNEKITSHGVKFIYPVTFNSTGGWQFTDSLECNSTFTFTNGNLNFSGQYARLNGFSSLSSTNPTRTLNIANSVIEIYSSGGWNYQGGAPLTADKSENSVIRISYNSSSSMNNKAGDIYNILEFTEGALNTSASVSRGTFKRITISKMNSGLNTITTDTLVYAPGGSTNMINANTTLTVNKLLVTNGTPCLPTTIQSATGGTRANISMPATAANVLPDTVLFEFVRIRDLNAVTGAGQAVLKKGPQSINDSGFGISGNNANWVMMPYAGALGFDGLGPDLGLGCTDFPRAIQLDPVYYAGSVGSYEWRIGSSTGTIIGTSPQLTINTPGDYFLRVNYDAAKLCFLTDEKIILASADSLIWTGGAGNSDWNNSTNWKKPDGANDVTTIPRGCTDVFIPAGTAVYPNLNLASTSRSVYADAACRNIHFASGAEVAYTDSLHYSKAYVDLTLQRDKWYMLSTPLQNMYSGDYWTAPWNVTAASGAVYNRNNPRIYMQQYQMQNPETGYYPGAASWSKAFNTLDVSMGIAQGFVVGIDQPGTDQTLHFPRPETKLEYFNKTTGLPAGIWTPTLNRANAFRMHIEPGFTGVIPVSWDSISRSTIIIGNPLMAHLNFTALQAGNPGVFGNSYYVWTGSSFDAFSVAGNQLTKTDWTLLSTNQIPPMQSFIVEKQNPASKINSIFINSGMALTAPGVNLRRNASATAEALNLTVYRDEVRQSAATLIPEGGKNVTTLFSGTVKEPAVVYFGTKEAPYSILGSDLEKTVEVGVRTTVKGILTFRIQGVETLSSGTRIFLEDKLLGTSQDMTTDPAYLFSNETGNIEGRFFLKSVNAATGIEETVKNPGISIHAAGNTVYLTSADEPIRKIEVFNVQGLLIYQADKLDRKEHSFSLNAEKQIILVKVTTENDIKTEKLQMQ